MLFRQHFRRDLRQGRFTMEFAQSGDIALQRITDAAGVSLILILSDINMPGMTGLELLPKAKAARPDVPVIMITAYGDADTKRKALESGAEALSPSRSISGRFAARLICASRVPLNQGLPSGRTREQMFTRRLRAVCTMQQALHSAPVGELVANSTSAGTAPCVWRPRLLSSPWLSEFGRF